MPRKNYIMYVAYIGHGKGADKSIVTKYRIGNPEIEGEDIERTKMSSGARSISMEDIETILGKPNTEQIKQYMKNNNISESEVNKFRTKVKGDHGKFLVPTISSSMKGARCSSEQAKLYVYNSFWTVNKNEFDRKYQDILFGAKEQWVAGHFTQVTFDVNCKIPYISSKDIAGYSLVHSYVEPEADVIPVDPDLDSPDTPNIPDPSDYIDDNTIVNKFYISRLRGKNYSCNIRPVVYISPNAELEALPSGIWTIK